MLLLVVAILKEKGLRLLSMARALVRQAQARPIASSVVKELLRLRKISLGKHFIIRDMACVLTCSSLIVIGGLA